MGIRVLLCYRIWSVTADGRVFPNQIVRSYLSYCPTVLHKVIDFNNHVSLPCSAILCLLYNLYILVYGESDGNPARPHDPLVSIITQDGN